MVTLRQGGLDLLQLGLALGTHQSREHSQRLVLLATGDQEARAFRNEEQGEEKDHRRQEHHPEHPAPRFEAEGQDFGGSARLARQQVVA